MEDKKPGCDVLRDRTAVKAGSQYSTLFPCICFALILTSEIGSFSYLHEGYWQRWPSLSQKWSKTSCEDEDQGQEWQFLPVLPTGHLTLVIVLVGSQTTNEELRKSSWSKLLSTSLLQVVLLFLSLSLANFFSFSLESLWSHLLNCCTSHSNQCLDTGMGWEGRGGSRCCRGTTELRCSELPWCIFCFNSTALNIKKN